MDRTPDHTSSEVLVPIQELDCVRIIPAAWQKLFCERTKGQPTRTGSDKGAPSSVFKHKSMEQPMGW